MQHCAASPPHRAESLRLSGIIHFLMMERLRLDKAGGVASKQELNVTERRSLSALCGGKAAS
jgi:hypothetical protein